MIAGIDRPAGYLRHMDEIRILPIGFLRNTWEEKNYDHGRSIRSRTKFAPEFPETCFDGIGASFHLENIFHFHRCAVTGTEHPRNVLRLPQVEIPAKCKKDRPKPFGQSKVRLLKYEGRAMHGPLGCDRRHSREETQIGVGGISAAEWAEAAGQCLRRDVQPPVNVRSSSFNYNRPEHGIPHQASYRR